MTTYWPSMKPHNHNQVAQTRSPCRDQVQLLVDIRDVLSGSGSYTNGCMSLVQFLGKMKRLRYSRAMIEDCLGHTLDESMFEKDKPNQHNVLLVNRCHLSGSNSNGEPQALHQHNAKYRTMAGGRRVGDLQWSSR